FRALLNRALALAGTHQLYCELSPRAVEGALESLIVRLPVYRTYSVCGEALSDEDRQMIEFAARQAREHLGTLFHPAIDFLVEVCTSAFGADEGDHFRTKFQQLTAPVMAKGAEDTAFFRYHRF